MVPSNKNLQERLIARKQELSERLERISENHRRPLSSDSEEQATETENSEVVDALGNNARDELRQVNDALHRLDSGSFGICSDCAQTIDDERLAAHPYALRCIDCATSEESQRTG